MSNNQMSSVPTRVQTVGYYNPLTRVSTTVPTVPSVPSVPSAPSTPSLPQVPGIGSSNGGAVKGFLGDVWAGSKEQLADYGDLVLHPTTHFKGGVVKPSTGSSAGKTVGRLLTHVVVLGGAYMGVRALLGGRLFGGGAKIGNSRNPILKFIGKGFSAVGRGISNVVGDVTSSVGHFLRKLIPFGSGAHIGVR